MVYLDPKNRKVDLIQLDGADAIALEKLQPKKIKEKGGKVAETEHRNQQSPKIRIRGRGSAGQGQNSQEDGTDDRNG